MCSKKYNAMQLHVATFDQAWPGMCLRMALEEVLNELVSASVCLIAPELACKDRAMVPVSL